MQRFLTSSDGGGLDAATASRAESALNALPEWVFNLRSLEQEIDRRATEEAAIAKVLLRHLKNAQPHAQRLQQHNEGAGTEVVNTLKQLQVNAGTIADSRSRGRKKKLSPTNVAVAMRGALKRAAISDSVSLATLKKCLPELGLSDPEIETALKYSRRYFKDSMESNRPKKP